MWTLQEFFDGGLISSVKISSVKALAMARSSRVSNWVKVSPRRRTSMARQLCPSVAVATQPIGRSTPTVISPSAISSAMLGRDKEGTADFFPAAVLSTLPVRLRVVGFRIKSVEFRRADQTVNGRGALATGVRSSKEIVFPTQSYGTQAAFGGVVVDLNASVIAIAHQRLPARERIANRRAGVGFPRQLAQAFFQPLPQRFEQRFGPCLADLLPLVRRAPSDLSFDGIQCPDALQSLGCQRRSVRLLQVVELAPHM